MSVKPVVLSAVMAASCSHGRANSMSVSRLFVESDLSAGSEAPLDEAQVHYLRHVMRRADGAPLLVFNGRDGEWRAPPPGQGKKGARGRPGRRPPRPAAAPPASLRLAPPPRPPPRH